MELKPLAKTFSLYRSSAGSGKTRTLAREYLKLAMKFRADYFKYILAVTFTNKASQEMKDRILDYLDDFAKGRTNELAEELKAELGCDEQTFQQHSQAVQSAILHQYGQFSISTIDAFFQKVIRSFTREAGLVGDYRLEVEHDAILEQVIDNLIDELGPNKELTDWVVEFARENLENERAWDVRYSLIDFAKEIFREEFKAVEDEVLSKTRGPSFFKNLMAGLRSEKYLFIKIITSKANEALALIHTHALTAGDFKYSGGGAYSFFVKASKISRVKDYNEDDVGKRPHAEYQKIANWPARETPNAKLILQLAQTRLLPLMNEILDCWREKYQGSLSAELVLNNFYSFGLITDIARKLKEFKDENNVMLLADAPKFLNGVIRDSDTPFIYEKVGSFYRNYLIDEFQDTSGMQWKNFQPLIINSLDQGHVAMVVGDVKQAIYRWRGGDLSLLQERVIADVGAKRTDVRELDSNYRSAVEIVSFNNALFRQAATAVSFETGASLSLEAYHDVEQRNAKNDTGFVQISFIEDPPRDEGLTRAGRTESWQTLALEQVPETLERLQLEGAALKDIAILVRKNEEGQRVASHLLQYKNSDKARPDCRYDVISNESLRIDGASTVNLLVAAMRYLLNPDDAIARAQLGYEFARLHEPHRELPIVFSVANQAIFENNLPADFTAQKISLKKLPLIELTETLIETFKLGDFAGELVYLQAFQDLVLDFYNRERNDLAAFLTWWDTNRSKKSVQISGNVDAVQIITIHKSKGLQFTYVILPFCSWNLDHDPWQAPNLWVKSDKGIFSDAGYIPVKYSKTLEQTCFSEYYTEEHTRSYVDNLNLLYVAFTRAELGLIVTAPHPSVRYAKGTVAGLLYECIQTSDVLKDRWNEELQCWRSGDWFIQKVEGSELSGALALPVYLSASWREKLVIRQSAKTFFDEPSIGRRDKIIYGIHMHTVLSRMKYADEVDSTLEDITFEGLISVQEKDELKKKIDDLLSVPPVSSWFSRDWTVFTEAPVLLPGGSENRLDRLIYRNKKAVVIDFKTGERSKTDNRQVLQYIQILRQMNFTEVEGYLLYLRDNEVVEVRASGKPLVVRQKKDRDQLSLGF